MTEFEILRAYVKELEARITALEEGKTPSTQTVVS